MVKKIKRYIYIYVILTLLIAFIGEKGEVVENLQIPAGIGYDLEGTSENLEYIIPMLIQNFEDGGKKNSYILIGKGTSMGETRESRQLLSSKKFMLGLNEVFLLGENAAKIGINPIVDILINNATINDRGVCVVCKEKTEEILKYKIKGYSTSAEFIGGMVKNLKRTNFFPMQYSVIDLIVRIDAEGRNVLLPYIELKEEGIETTGIAIFKGDKMVSKVSLEEAKIINILKESNVRGILTIQDDSKKYISCYATSKRKIKCYKNDGKYNFIINLDLKGQIVSNTLYENLSGDVKQLKRFEEDMKSNVEKNCNEIINKVKNEHKVDFLDLGRVAAAKYGRGTGVDWNEIISDSKIRVNVKFTVDTEGRGSY